MAIGLQGLGLLAVGIVAASVGSAVGQGAVPAAPPAATAPLCHDPGDPAMSSSSMYAQAAVAEEKPRIRSGADAEVTVLEKTMLRVMSKTPLGSGTTRVGAPVLFTLDHEVVVDHVLIIPRGASVRGVVVESRKSGALTGSAGLVLQLVSLELGGRSYPLYTYRFEVKGTSKTQPTQDKVVGGATAGAFAAGAYGVSTPSQTIGLEKLAEVGAGAVVGAGIGTIVAAVGPGPRVKLPAESEMDFYLASPISVVPVSAQEAARLGQRVSVGGPVLYVRGETP